MPDPTPVALIGDLLATQALDQGVVAMLVDGAVRDLDELRELGLPIWARYVRAQGAAKTRSASSTLRSSLAAHESSAAT